MTRSVEERIAAVRGLLAGARAVHADRARLVPLIARATGLSAEGVELGFESLELRATTDELRALVAASGNAAHVHVILSANVFVAPLRAIAVARAAALRVTVRASPRDPVLSQALVAAANDPSIEIVDERDPAALDADRIDVYGRDETVAKVRARARSGVVVRGHGAGLGIAVVTSTASVGDAAEALASDVVPFDQRGCLSPRAVFVEGAPHRAEAFAEALDGRLAAWASRIPRGLMTEEEASDAARWKETLAFAGRVWAGAHHAVAFGPNAAFALPPAGRHVLVSCVGSLREIRASMAPVARFVVAVGTNDPARWAASADGCSVLSHASLSHARIVSLGAMQRPPLDGSVDRRQSIG